MNGARDAGPQGDDAYLRLYIAQSPKYAMGFTGFKGARDDNTVSGQILFGGNFTNKSPRLTVSARSPGLARQVLGKCRNRSPSDRWP